MDGAGTKHLQMVEMMRQKVQNQKVLYFSALDSLQSYIWVQVDFFF